MQILTTTVQAVNPVEGTAVLFAALSCALVLGLLIYAPFFFMLRAYKKRHGAEASRKMAQRALRQASWSVRMVRDGFNEERSKY